MKILFISTSDTGGGAAIAAVRLMQALHRQGEDVKMLVRNKNTDLQCATELGTELQNKLNFYWERLSIFALNNFSRENLFDISIANTGLDITSHPYFIEADVIHLHWINQGMLSLKTIGKIVSSGKKIVWTMHDMWAFTGICHHARACINYHVACGNCFYLKKPADNDLSHRIYLKKQKLFEKGNISFVACSEWLKSKAKKSPLTNNQQLFSIPNPIDTAIYAPQDKAAIRQKLGLPLDKKIILFAAVKASDKRKGIDYLIEATKILKKKTNDVYYVIIGKEGATIANELAAPAVCPGFISSDKMPEWYNAADLFVTPSLQENLPNTIMESLACGTPCLGFHVGGIPEMIEHKKNGYLAAYEDAEDLAQGLYWILYEAVADDLQKNARSSAIMKYSEMQVASHYKKIYLAR